MKLEAITAKVRPRIGWEALDLGFRMVHQHWKSMFGIWFGLTMPLFIISLYLFWENNIWVMVIFWWLKPLFETALLNYVSRALFGEFPDLKSTLKNFHRYAFKQWFAQLTWRRFSPTRSMDMAVSQLEGLSGEHRSRRISTLHSFNSGAASWLTLMFVLFHLLFYINLVTLALWLIPDVYLLDLEDTFTEFFWSSQVDLVQFIQLFSIYLIFSFFTPFYVAAGFSIYINQRTILEAWDIELAFKRLAQRTEQQKKKQHQRSIAKHSTTHLGLILMVSLFFNASDLGAQQSDPNQPLESGSESAEQTVSVEPLYTHEHAKTQIEEILQNEPFQHSEQKKRTVYDFNWDDKSDNNDADDEEQNDSSSSRDFLSFFSGFAKLAEVILWIGLAALIAWAIIKFQSIRNFFQGGPKTNKKKKHADVLFGLELTPESLPDDPAIESWKLWQKGQHRVAYSLLLRATLTRLIQLHHCEFENGFTELECARIVRATTHSRIADYFEKMIHLWRLFAYGHQLPQSAEIEILCRDWPALFILENKPGVNL